MESLKPGSSSQATVSPAQSRTEKLVELLLLAPAVVIFALALLTTFRH